MTKANANTEKMYERLVKDWSTIFPDGNRNAAGPRFFKYILDQNLEYEEFIPVSYTHLTLPTNREV